jgi:protein-S-isoprenylcysteine O-methyltransferase Ste14
MNEIVMVQAKPWYKSKTVIVNLLIMLATMLGALQVFVGTIADSVPGSVASILATLIAAVNILLRFFTDKPVASTSKPVQVEQKIAA